MFLRQQGRRIYLLHSYRDGRGRVCQRRLGHFDDAAGLERQWADLPSRCPEVARGALSKLRGQAEALLSGITVKPLKGAEHLRRATRALLNLLAESDAEALREVSDDLDLLQARLSQPVDPADPGKASDLEGSSDLEGAREEGLRRRVLVARSQLSPRRRKLDPTEAQAKPYVDSMDRLAHFLAGQNRLSESAEVWRQRLSCCQSADAHLAYGAVLHKLDRRPEALEQYSRVPNTLASRHYNSAAALWQEERPEEALVHLLRGFTRAPRVVEALRRSETGKPVLLGGEYWHEFGDLWTASGRRFALAVCSQFIVRLRLRQMLERRVQARDLVPARSRPGILQKVMKSLQ